MNATLRGTMLAVCMGASMVGCGNATPGTAGSGGGAPSGDIGEVHSKAAAFDLDDWTAWTMPINVCFMPFSSDDPAHFQEIPDEATYSALKGHALDALQVSWGSIPNVSFANAGDCSSWSGP